MSRWPCSSPEMQTRRTTTWFETWRTSMRRWLSRRVSTQSADVDEIAHEVYLRLLGYSDETLADSPQDHLFRIASGVTNEWHERVGGDTRDWPAPSEQTEQWFVDDPLHTAVGNLPQQQRDALLLHLNEDLTYRKVAARLKLTPRAARHDIVCAYVNLRYELSSVKVDVICTG